jgi:hypothetical protein
MQAGDYIVTASALWLRDGAGTNFAQLALMPQGAVFNADGGEQNGFASGTFGAVQGWASIQYLEPVGSQMSVSPADVQAADNLLITGQDVAFRSEPKISEPAFGNGSNVSSLTNKSEIVSNDKIQDNGFQAVKYKGQDGWISVLYLQPTSSAPTPGLLPIPINPLNPPTPPPVSPASDQPPEVQTEVGKMSGGMVAVGLLALAAGIYFLAK